MAGELENDPSRLRISDGDRHKVAEVLREAAGEGRLDMEELEERLEATYAAKTYGDLVPLTVDLPVGQDPLTLPVQAQGSSVPAGHAARYETSWAIMSGVTRTGRWEVGPTHTAVSVMGGVDIDLREAVFTGGETVINAYTFWGGVDIVVNAGTRVIVEGIGVMGAFEQARDKVTPEIGPGAPLVRVKGMALMGAVTVVRKPMPGERKRRKMLGH